MKVGEHHDIHIVQICAISQLAQMFSCEVLNLILVKPKLINIKFITFKIMKNPSLGNRIFYIDKVSKYF